MQRPARVGPVLGLRRALLGLLGAQAVDPGAGPIGRAAGGDRRGGERLQRRRDVADEVDVGDAVALEPVRLDVDADQLRVRADRGAEAEPEVERDADDRRRRRRP